MDDKPEYSSDSSIEATASLAEFADSYASFNRIVNSLQRKYIELREEFSAQQEKLVEANKRLVEMSSRNLAVTEFLNGILQGMAAGVIAVDERGRITHFNPAASLMLGIPVGEPTGRYYREVIPPGEPIEANALRATQSGRAVDSVEKVWRLADGTRLIVSVSTAIMTDEQGKSIGAVEVFHDLTKIKKMEQEITRLNTLAALGEMAAAVAHQVRNPLSGILGYGSLLKRDMDENDSRQKLVNRICDGVETLNRTVTTLLDYTRREEIRRREIVFRDFLVEAVRQFHRDHEGMAAGMRIIVPQADQADPAGVVWLDPVLFRQVLFNLFCNSTEACGGNGEIQVEYRKLPRQSATAQYADRLLLGLDETVFEVIVRDNGPGVPLEALDSLFAPFFTTREGGNGLGLAMSWKIMKAHGGDIALDRAFTGGARFVLLLPVRISSAEAPAG
ncbi:MAG: ATP-binding protein [Candidatus Zixiibacteriota bacterium]